MIISKICSRVSALFLTAALSGCIAQSIIDDAPPTSIERNAALVDPLAKILFPPAKSKESYLQYDGHTTTGYGGYTENEFQNVMKIQQRLGRHTPVIPGHMLPIITTCLHAIKASNSLDAQNFCMVETTVTISAEDMPQVEAGPSTPNFTGPHYMTFFPWQPLPEAATELIGQVPGQCGEGLRTRKATKLTCIVDPADGFPSLAERDWGARYGYRHLQSNPARRTDPQAFTPFATASVRPLEDAYSKQYQFDYGSPYGMHHPTVPGRLLPAVCACADYVGWVSRDRAGDLDLNEYLVVVREVVPSEYDDPKVFDLVPNTPLIEVQLSPQPMPLTHFPADQQKQMKADGLDKKVPSVKAETCLVDPRSDKVYGAFPAVEARTWAGED